MSRGRALVLRPLSLWRPPVGHAHLELYLQADLFSRQRAIALCGRLVALPTSGETYKPGAYGRDRLYIAGVCAGCIASGLERKALELEPEPAKA